MTQLGGGMRQVLSGVGLVLGIAVAICVGAVSMQFTKHGALRIMAKG